MRRGDRGRAQGLHGNEAGDTRCQPQRARRCAAHPARSDKRQWEQTDDRSVDAGMPADEQWAREDSKSGETQRDG